MKNHNIIKNIIYYFEKFLDIIYPPKCMLCSKILNLNTEKWLCSKCKNIIYYIDENKCKKCGINMKNDINISNICSNCIIENKYFDYNIAIFEYNNVMKTIIHAFKYGKKASHGKGIAYIISKKFLENPSYYKDIDYISYVPIHKKRMISRGFNQSEIIAKELSKYIKIKVLKNLLIRIKNTKPQSGLSKIARINNIKKSIILNNKYDIKNKKILLIDDIYTTGSTLNECSRILINAGACLVRTSTVCIVNKERKNII